MANNLHYIDQLVKIPLLSGKAKSYLPSWSSLLIPPNQAETKWLVDNSLITSQVIRDSEQEALFQSHHEGLEELLKASVRIGERTLFLATDLFLYTYYWTKEGPICVSKRKTCVGRAGITYSGEAGATLPGLYTFKTVRSFRPGTTLTRNGRASAVAKKVITGNLNDYSTFQIPLKHFAGADNLLIASFTHESFLGFHASKGDILVSNSDAYLLLAEIFTHKQSFENMKLYVQMEF